MSRGGMLCGGIREIAETIANSDIECIGFSFENESMSIVECKLLIDSRCATIGRKKKRLGVRGTLLLLDDRFNQSLTHIEATLAS